MNFVFKGFGITGRIANIGGDATNVDIQLRSADGKDVRYTKSDANGDFFFTPVVPARIPSKLAATSKIIYVSVY